jgi:hypothetical protein
VETSSLTCSVTDELEEIRKEAITGESRHYPGICLEERRKTTKDPNRNAQCQGERLNPAAAVGCVEVTRHGNIDLWSVSPMRRPRSDNSQVGGGFVVLLDEFASASLVSVCATAVEIGPSF